MHVKPSISDAAKGKAHPDLGRCGGFVHIQAPKSFVILMGAIFLVLTLAIGVSGFWVGRHLEADHVADASRNVVLPLNRASSTYAAKTGPWGALECQRTYLEVPEEYLGTRSLELDSPRWFFKKFSPEQLRNLFQTANLTSPASAELMNAAHWQVASDGIWVSPSSETIFSLSSQSRELIYAVLAQFRENALQNQPFHWRADALDASFVGAEISDETKELFHKLCYHRGDVVLFSDPATLLAALPNQAEKNGFGKVLMRRPVVFGSLLVTPQSDINSLINYWGINGAGKDLRPLLEAATKIPGGRRISLSALLPAQARGRVYTFPFLKPDEHLNCHWTAFNFFKKDPDPPTEDTAVWKRKLDSEYRPVADQPRYGDLLVFARPDGRIIHSCVYLADDLVYTKNGASPLAPWQVSTISDILDFYSWDLPQNTALRMAYFRSRNV